MSKKLCLSCFLYSVLTPVCLAQDVTRIPEQGGWSGRIGAGMSYRNYSSNVIAGSGFDTLDNRTVSSLQQGPSSESEFSGNPFFDVRYTLDKVRGQFYLGFLIQDAVRLDFAQSLGYRQQVDGAGILSAAYVFSGIPSKVYEDTYLVGEPRKDTDRKSQGFRLAWESVYDTPFSFNYTYRDIQLDRDLNGQSALDVGEISPQEQAMLVREGTHHRFELQYDLVMGRGKVLTPMLLYRKRDLDGAAMAGESYGLQLSYASLGPKWGYILNGYYGERTYDAGNPVFDDKYTDANEYTLNINVILREPFNRKNWSALFSAAYLESDSKVDFYDMDSSSLGVNLLYSF